MLTPEEAARLACVSPRTVYRWVEAGRLHFSEMPDGGLFICLASLFAEVGYGLPICSTFAEESFMSSETTP